eukprot:COSAG01_NODE_3544_length_5952_cov_291.756193_1_plen_172_part_00
MANCARPPPPGSGLAGWAHRVLKPTDSPIVTASQPASRILHAGKSQCMPGSPPRAAARSRQACRQIPVHARRAAAAPGAARPATPAELVAVALSPLSCSREPRTLPAAFLVVRSYCPHALAAAGSVEQALSNITCGARLLPWERRTAAALHSRGRASGPKGRRRLRLWVMV